MKKIKESVSEKAFSDVWKLCIAAVCLSLSVSLAVCLLAVSSVGINMHPCSAAAPSSCETVGRWVSTFLDWDSNTSGIFPEMPEREQLSAAPLVRNVCLWPSLSFRCWKAVSCGITPVWFTSKRFPRRTRERSRRKSLHAPPRWAKTLQNVSKRVQSRFCVRETAVVTVFPRKGFWLVAALTETLALLCFALRFKRIVSVSLLFYQSINIMITGLTLYRSRTSSCKTAAAPAQLRHFSKSSNSVRLVIQTGMDTLVLLGQAGGARLCLLCCNIGMFSSVEKSNISTWRP